MPREQVIQQEIRLAINAPHVRMFRNNVGSIKDKDGRLVTCSASITLSY